MRKQPHDTIQPPDGVSGSRELSGGRTLLSPGQKLDHFKVIELIGRGGMGDVYLARDTKLGRKVALKLVQPADIGGDDAMKRFLFEARTTAKFSHPNIVTVYAVGEHGGLPYLALEYLRGQTLDSRMAEERFSPRNAARIAMAIGEALVEAHRHGVLHRDLKPENVLVPPDGRLRVVDFGLARQLEASPLSKLPPPSTMVTADTLAAFDLFQTDGGVKGTPMYMAPEQWAAETLDEAVDVWALGLILYELISGRHPFEDLNSQALIIAVYDPKPVPPMEASETFPRPLVDLISRCVAKLASERPTAAEVVAELKAFLQFGVQRLAEGQSPFRGLLPFTEQHAQLFFGRDVEIDRFVERLRQQAVLPVVGPSGAGKSSLVRAGIIARMADSERWLVVRMRPGRQPFETLAARLQRARLGPPERDSARGLDEHDSQQHLSPLHDQDETDQLAASLAASPWRLALHLEQMAEQHDSKVLLFVDQLEELCTMVEDVATRRRFMDALCSTIHDAQLPLRVVFTVRDDFLGRLALSEIAREALSYVTVCRPPSEVALRDILHKPLEVVGYRYDDPTLIDEMVAAVGGEATALPLLQFVGEQLWEQRDKSKKLLLRSAYERAGGVEGALAQHADGVIEALSVSETRVARQLLLRLVTGERTRKVVPQSELNEGLGDEAAPVLERLIRARLLTVRKPRGASEQAATVELAHESLIDRWNTLRRWLDEGQDDLVFLAEASQAAKLWDQRGKRDEELWEGVALADARRMVGKSSQVLPERVQRFIAAAERKRARRVRLTRLVRAAVVTGLTLVVVVLGIQNQRVEQKHAEAQRQRAEAQQQRAKVQVKGARSALRQGNLLPARGQLRLALETADAPSARVLWWQLRNDPRVWRKEFGALVYDVAFSPDGKYVAAANLNKVVYLVDTETRAVKVLRGHDDQVLSVAFSPDGRQLASGSADGTLRFWDARTAKLQRSLKGHTAPIFSVSFSPDGRQLASASLDKTVRIWETETAKQLRTLEGHTAWVRGVRFSPDGRQLASASLDKTVRLWNTETAKLLRTLEGHTAGVDGVSFSPDGRRLASASFDKTVRIWDTKTAKTVRTLKGHTASVQTVNFSPDGRRLASAGIDKTVRLWDTETAKLLRTLEGHTAGVRRVIFSPDGRRLASASFDKTVRLWDTETAKTVRTPDGHTDAVYAIRFSPDGRWIASASFDKTVRLWDTDTAKLERILEGHTDAVYAVHFSPNGRRLASSSSDATVRLWNTETAKQLHTLEQHTDAIWTVDFSPDGRQLASSSDDQTVRLWNVETAKLVRTLEGHTGAVRGVSFSPDGRRLASGSDDKTVRLWDARTGKLELVLKQPARAHWLDFHPDGRRLGVPGSDGVTRIWDIEKKEVTATLVGHRGSLHYTRFSPDGLWAATSSEDNTVRLWNANSGHPVWRAPLLIDNPPRLYSHQGWRRLDDGGPSGNTGTKASASTTKWQAAVEQRARFAEATPDGKWLCLQSFDNQLELWSIAGDARLLKQPVRGMVGTRAATNGCLVRTEDDDGGRALFFNSDGSEKNLPSEGKITGLGVNPGELFVAAGTDVYAFDARGARLGRFAANIGITTIARIDTEQLAVGFSSGNIELVAAPKKTGGQSPSDSRSQEADPAKPLDPSPYSFVQTPSSPVTRLLLGPMDTLIAAFANGTLSLYSWHDGNQLITARIHGPIEHLLLDKPKLYAASSLGQHLVWDLSALYAERCPLLREVWQHVPVVWREGRAVREPPPADHPCRVR